MMKKEWLIKYYDEKVRDSIFQLPVGLKVRYFVVTDTMKIRGPNLGTPHTEAMGDGLFEIRLKSKEGIARVFYCVMIDQEIWMLHSFIKKTQKTPKNELAIGYKRLKELKNER